MKDEKKLIHIPITTLTVFLACLLLPLFLPLFSCTDGGQITLPDADTENGRHDIVSDEESKSAVSDEQTNDLPENDAETGEHNNRDHLQDREVEQKEKRDNEDANDQTNLPRIGVYNGVGSWDLNVDANLNFLEKHGFTSGLFDEDDAVNLDLSEQFDMIWFPGGFSGEYNYLISSHDNIRSFVASGGAFIGSCAGAYYASDILRWKGSNQDYRLALFDGIGAGPLIGLINWGEIATLTLTEEHPANEGFADELGAYYMDGPYFIPHNEDENNKEQQIEILARYSVNEKPAVIAGRYGDGKYLLLGPHPELGGYSPGSADMNVEGEEGAQWPWLLSSLLWFYSW